MARLKTSKGIFHFFQHGGFFSGVFWLFVWVSLKWVWKLSECWPQSRPKWYIIWGVVFVALSNMVCGVHNLAVCASTWTEQGFVELMVKHGLDVSGPKSWRNAFQVVPRCVCIICCTVGDFDAVIDRLHNCVLCYTNTRGTKCTMLDWVVLQNGLNLWCLTVFVGLSL